MAQSKADDDIPCRNGNACWVVAGVLVWMLPMTLVFLSQVTPTQPSGGANALIKSSPTARINEPQPPAIRPPVP